jgi:glycosyltransferase involved in cell wall biosynthesis
MINGLVSTIIPVFNRAKMLEEAVSSVVNQSYKRIEIIIVDDGSTDETSNVGELLSRKDKRVKYTLIENSGPARAREVGRNLAQGEFIQYLDSDDLLHPEKFSKQVAGLNENAECGVSYCPQEYREAIECSPRQSSIRGDRAFKMMFPAMLADRFWATPGPIYRATLLEKNGPWMNLINSEDWEYDCRLASLGVKLHYCPEVLVTIRQHDTGHLGRLTLDETRKLADRSQAYQAIYNHALAADISIQSPEFMRFNRTLFMQARRCARVGLRKEAKILIGLCKHSASTFRLKLEYYTFQCLSNLLGWKTIGQLSVLTDRFRR